MYVQNLHGGAHSWLGLSDINTEGTFVWSDGTPLDFHYWAKHQPNNFQNEDCVHTLGFQQDHKYEWNDVNCTNCYRFSCKKGTCSIFDGLECFYVQREFRRSTYILILCSEMLSNEFCMNKKCISSYSQ